MWAGLRPQEPFHWKSAGGRPDVSPSKKRTPLALALLSARNRAFLETWICSKRAPSLNIWPSLNIEPTLSQISEETLESLKLRERNSRKNFERQTAPSKPPEGHPQSDVTQRRAEFPQATQRHFNLKASIKQPLKWLNRVVFISKSKDNRVLLLMIDMGKIVWK